MNARAQLERLFGGPAPVEAPPQPGVKPGIAPSRPSTPAPTRRPNPFRRKTGKPGDEPRPKSRFEQRVRNEALELLKANDLGEFVK